MGLFGALTRGYLLRRLLRGGGHPGAGHRRPGRYAPPPRSRGRSRRPRSGFGMWGPVPTYRHQTRRGSQVSVGGCCLPILVLALGLVAAAVSALL